MKKREVSPKYTERLNSETGFSTIGCMKDMIEAWHDKVKPDYIFMTETAATPYGAVIKEAWKKAYPGEKVPRIYRVDSHAIPGASYYEDNVGGSFNTETHRRWRQFIRRRVKNPETAKVIVWNESYVTGRYTPILAYAIAGGGNARSLPDYYKVESNHLNLLKSKLEEDGNKLYKIKEDYAKRFNDVFNRAGERVFPRRKNIVTWQGVGKETCHFGEFDQDLYRGDNRVTHRASGHGPGNIRTFKAEMIKDPQKRRQALQALYDLKQLGRDIGGQIRQEREAKKKGIEETLGIISIAGFLISFLFFSGITGNVIGATNLKNVLGVVFILIGLVFGGIYFYFKNKK